MAIRATKWGIQNTQGTTIEEIKSQIQEDLMIYLDGMDDRIVSEVCKIVSDNFNTLKTKTK